MKNTASSTQNQEKPKQTNKLDARESRVAYEMKILMTRYGWTYASQRKIADRSGMSRGTVNKILSKLHILEYLFKVYRGIRRTCAYYPSWPRLKTSSFSFFNCQSELSYTTKDVDNTFDLDCSREPVIKPVVGYDANNGRVPTRGEELFAMTYQVENILEAYILMEVARKYGCGFCEIAVEMNHVPWKFCGCGLWRHLDRILSRVA